MMPTWDWMLAIAAAAVLVVGIMIGNVWLAWPSALVLGMRIGGWIVVWRLRQIAAAQDAANEAGPGQ